jgi:glycosyltransferase involved in cell wall biosynthesis
VQWIMDRNESGVADVFSQGGIAYLPFFDGASERRGSLKAVLASGLPTITTESNQTTDNIRAAVVIASNPSVAYQRICDLVASPNARRALMAAALRYSEPFSWKAIAESHLKLYEGVEG